MSKANVTKIKKIKVNTFRGLSDITINFGDRITLICGKNGTSKSTILGIAAQVFSFRKDYELDKEINFKTLTDDRFESTVSDHFRLSKAFDKSGSMDTDIFIHDGYTKKEADFSLRLYEYADRRLPRPIVRGNSSASGNTSRNATHPVIFLSLNRLTPISFRSKYSEHSIQFLQDNEEDFLSLNHELLGKFTASKITTTTGSIKSAAAHGENYDQNSVSAGEDNAGQILQALYSFKKLKQDYSDYKGGLLLIDEADAGLFPAAQSELIKILNRECKTLDLQVIMTSHSPIMIEQIHSSSKVNSRDNKVIYLTDTFGSITSLEDYSWPEIYADLNEQTVKYSDEISLPLINTYFEDKETYDFFNAIVRDRKIRKVTNCLEEVSLGCDEYKKLIDRKVPEFSKRSLIVVDGDVDVDKRYRSIICLPSVLPPEQLIFEFLFNLPATHIFWRNSLRYSRTVFMRSANKIINELSINRSTATLDLQATIEAYRNNGQPKSIKLRRLFKDEFAHSPDFLKLVKGKVSENPYRLWVKENSQACEAFKNLFISKLKQTLTLGHGLDSARLSILE